MTEELQKVITSDNSITYYNPEVDECYHTRTGALEEALKKHVEPSNVVELAKDGDVVIGDVCFGLGYNTIVAIAKIQEKYPDALIQVFAFENDLRILEKIQNLELPKQYQNAHEKIKTLLHKDSIKETTDECSLYVYEDEKLTMSLYLGDVEQTIHKISHEVLNVVFFDPFSPTKQANLWSNQFVVNVAATMARGGVLTTYSCARPARDALRFAGLEVHDGPIVGRSSPGSLGIKPLLDLQDEEKTKDTSSKEENSDENLFEVNEEEE